jgi:ABC-2 type transport system ATP-binding protein
MAEIECLGLSKSYGTFRALDDVHLCVEPGEIFGFLGPNGAGKTTTIRLLMGMLIPSSGYARIRGLDSHADRAELKRHVGYLPDNPVFQDYLRGIEVLRFVGKMHGFDSLELEERVSSLVRNFGIEDAAEEFAVNYSSGMKRKLGLACAQIHSPSVYILDEPTNGLDPIAQKEVLDWIRYVSRSGKTVFLSTHLLEMAERLCTRVGIIDRGRLRAVGTVDELREQLADGGSLEDVFLAAVRHERAE